jgi:hypothetical protein
MLHQGILHIGLRQRNLVFVLQIQIIDTAYQSLQSFLLAQSFLQGRYQSCLAGPLHTVQSNEEGLCAMFLLVYLEPGQDEGNAVRGLVVDYLWFCG